MHEPKPDPGVALTADERPSPFLRAAIVLGVDDVESAQREALEGLLTSQPGWFLETTGPEWSPVELTERALEAGAELVVAAGGDGTVSAVAGVLATAGDEETRPAMAVLPFGTANDFARTLAVHDLDAAVAALAAPDVHAIDVVVARFAEGDERVVLNVANGGLAWDIGAALEEHQKSAWGALAYARGALEVVGNPTVHEVALQLDDGMSERFEALTVAVSNGRACGGGLQLAPTADPEDGLIEITALRPGAPAAVAALAARMRLGAVESDELLLRFRGRSVTLDSVPPMHFVLDGELLEAPPIRFEVAPGAVRMLVGRDYAREPLIG